MLTFKHLYDYIQTAERDNTGVHHIYEPRVWFKNSYDISFHIYDNKHQVNVLFNSKVVANFVFDIDQRSVSIYPVDINEVCDYSNGLSVSIDTCIDSVKSDWSKHISKNRKGDNYKYLGGGIGDYVRDVLVDVLYLSDEEITFDNKPTLHQILSVIYIDEGSSINVVPKNWNGSNYICSINRQYPEECKYYPIMLIPYLNTKVTEIVAGANVCDEDDSDVDIFIHIDVEV